MNVIRLLEEEHKSVDELFRRFQIAEKPATLDKIAREIVHDLSVHAAVEELFVYPLVRLKVSDGSETARGAVGEHADVKELLARIEKLDAGTPDHTNTMMQVVESVRRHVEEEEGAVFPALAEATKSATLDRVGDLVEQAKKVVPTRPHPLVPGTATAQLIAGPWAAIADRIRDAVET